jgi:hypothetical protein
VRRYDRSSDICFLLRDFPTLLTPPLPAPLYTGRILSTETLPEHRGIRVADCMKEQ